MKKYILIRSNAIANNNSTLEEQCLGVIKQLNENLKANNLKQSNFYWSLGVSNKAIIPDYANVIIEFDTNLTPLEIIKVIIGLEKQYLHKTTTNKTAKKLVKILLLDYNSIIKNNHLVKLPFPELHKKSYIIMPIFDLNPLWQHPVLKQTITNIAAKINKNDLLN